MLVMGQVGGFGWIGSAAVAVSLAGCTPAGWKIPAQPDRPDTRRLEERAHAADAALIALTGVGGPARFAEVTPRLYRGGQPDPDDLEQLYALGVRTIIDLRREKGGLRRAEQAYAEQLGIRFVDFPFYGVFGADAEFLDSILVEMAGGGMQDGAVYVHCKNGRDRTSLVVALYRVAYEGWDQDVAWQEEVLEYDHDPSRFYRRIGTAYRGAAELYEAEAALAAAQPSTAGQQR